MRDFINIGPTPPGEDCAQVGSEDYWDRATKECITFIHQLRRHFGEEPASAVMTSKEFPHDFGYYREVICYYDTEDEEAQNYAFRLESETPEYWDEEAKKELQEREAYSKFRCPKCGEIHQIGRMCLKDMLSN